MTQEEYIDESVTEIEDYVSSMERSMDDLVNEYLTTFKYENGNLLNEASNYEKSNSSDSVFDDAFKTFIGAFLLFLGNKILKGADLVVKDMEVRGISTVDYNKKLTEKMIGFVDGKVVRGGYIWNLGKMSVLRAKLHDYIIKSISSAQKMNLVLKNVKPMFVSKGKVKSDFSKYYSRYAYDSIQQATNSIALYIANKNGLNRFEYFGGLVKNSRPFCIEHHGQIFTRKDAQRFEEMSWKGKNFDVPFLISVGGYQCFHTIKWLPNE